MALRSTLSDPRQYFLPVRCPNCASIGSILWEGLGEHKTLVSMSDEFYERLGRLPPHPIELVCRACGTPQLE
jgi:phage FluMu protein Com